jgi:hypothetical protein
MYASPNMTKYQVGLLYIKSFVFYIKWCVFTIKSLVFYIKYNMCYINQVWGVFYIK